MNINTHDAMNKRWLSFQDKSAILLKGKSTPDKVGLRYTLTSNSPSQIVPSTSRNRS